MNSLRFGHSKLLDNERLAMSRSVAARRNECGPASNAACETALSQGPSRRRFLRNTMTGTLAPLGSVLGIEFALPSFAPAQNPLSPDAALQELTAGNQRFTTGSLTAHEHDLAILKQHTIDKQ